MIRKSSKLISLFILSFFLTGCWDYKDINERSIGFSFGIDRIDDNIEFSSEIVKLVSQSDNNGQESQSQGVYTILSHGKDFEKARMHYDAESPFPVFLGATRIVIFGKKFAKEGIEPYLNRINKFYDYRKTLVTVVSRETPRKLFELKIDESIAVGFLIGDIVNNLKDNKMTIYSNIGEMLSDIAMGDIGFMLPYVGIEYGSIKYLGLAVMKDSKLVGIVNMKDTDGILYILADKPVLTESIYSSEKKNNKYSLKTHVKKRKIKTEYKNDKVLIKIKLDVDAEIRYEYYLKPVSDEEIKRLENMVSEKIERDIINIFKRSQEEFKCDIFHFAKYFRADHPRIYDEINWKEIYPKSNIEINIETKIIDLGLMDTNAKKK